MGEEEKKDPGFRVSDRRRFSVSESGEARETGAAAQEDKKPPAAEAREAATPPGGKPESSGRSEERKKREAETQQEPTALPEINFSTFVVSLSSSALIHLGIAPDPVSGERKKELPLAKQTIDMLGMLQEKTRGNLTEEEGKLLESMLYDLRMMYVAESKK